MNRKIIQHPEFLITFYYTDFSFALLSYRQYSEAEVYLCENFSEIIFVDQVEDILNDLHQRFDREFFNNKNQTKVNFLAMNAQNVEIPLSGNIILAGVGTASDFRKPSASSYFYF